MITYKEMIQLMEKQFALDYNCNVEDFASRDTLVTVSKQLDGARKYEEQEKFLSILSYRGKLVITADQVLQKWCQEELADNMSAEWGLDIGRLLTINDKLKEYGYHIESARTHLVPKKFDMVADERVTFLTPAEIDAYWGNNQIDEAFVFEDYIQNVTGAVIHDGAGEICAIAGATNNGKYLWDLGVNSFAEGKGYGTAVIQALIRQVLELGKVPYYNTAISHMASQNVALRAGMVPMFCEMRAGKISE